MAVEWLPAGRYRPVAVAVAVEAEPDAAAEAIGLAVFPDPAVSLFYESAGFCFGL
jgi:hypothetical protein